MATNKARNPETGSPDPAPGRGPVLDPDVTELMTLSANLQRATGRQLRNLWRTRKLSERGLFIIDPDGILQYRVVHNLSVGRNVEETLRVLSALQTGELCPLGWKPGEKTLGK